MWCERLQLSIPILFHSKRQCSPGYQHPLILTVIVWTLYSRLLPKADGVNVFYGVIPLKHSVFSLYNAYNRQPYDCPSAMKQPGRIWVTATTKLWIIKLMQNKVKRTQKDVHILWDIQSNLSILCCRDQFAYASSQWETMLQCNVISYWLGACTELSMMLTYAMEIVFRLLALCEGNPIVTSGFHTQKPGNVDL